MKCNSPECITPQWGVPSHIHAFSTKRIGGFSQAPFDSFNLADHVGDDPAMVKQNRERLVDCFHLPSEPIWLQQEHTIEVSNLDHGQPSQASDAAITTLSNKVCAIMTADCVPVLLCAKNGSEVAAIHAGRKGILNNIIARTIQNMETSPDNIIAWIGPAISQKNYEVEEDCYQEFLGKDDCFKKLFKKSDETHYMLNLPLGAENQLRNQGVDEIYHANVCTYDNIDAFYSYRRDGITGRMASLIWIGHD